MQLCSDGRLGVKLGSEHSHRQMTPRAHAQGPGPSTAPPFLASASLATVGVPAQVATDSAPAAVPAPASAPGNSSAAGSGNAALAAVAANCSHISADAALRNARASLASAGALPLGDSWCAACD